jgi:hypothetical protein
MSSRYNQRAAMKGLRYNSHRGGLVDGYTDPERKAQEVPDYDTEPDLDWRHPSIWGAKTWRSYNDGVFGHGDSIEAREERFAQWFDTKYQERSNLYAMIQASTGTIRKERVERHWVAQLFRMAAAIYTARAGKTDWRELNVLEYGFMERYHKVGDHTINKHAHSSIGLLLGALPRKDYYGCYC